MKNYRELVDRLRSHAPSKEEGLRKRITFWVVTILVGGLLLGLISLAALIGIISVTLPDISSLEKLSAAQSTEIYDKNGGLLYTIHGEENREVVPLADISKNLINATIAIEDSEFYTHSGFDISGIAVAIFHELTGIGAPRGGSTITQQYIKNAFLSSERSYLRKLKELILAIKLERTYDKNKILELYLNRIPYGNNAYGIQKAAEIYFNKNAKDLTLAESAVLAALPQAPSRYNPFGSNKYSHLVKEFTPEELFVRKINSEQDLDTSEFVIGCLGQNVDIENGQKIYIAGRSDVILARMEALGYITHEQRQQAVNDLQKITFNTSREDIKSPHFVLYLKQLLEDKYGKDIVETGGLKVYTTLDPDLQKYAEKIALEKGTSNEKTFGANNVAIFAIDAKTGEILAMVGSRDYNNVDIDGNVNVVTRPRQPGSSFKPIVYAQAFYNGYGPASVVYDVPINFGGDTPQDFDGRFMGRMTIRRALGQSRNLPAVQAYFLAGGQNYIIDLATRLGITSLDKNHDYGYPLALGAGEVSLYEMVQAYSVFANTGLKPDIVAIKKIVNMNGDVIEEYKSKALEQVLDPQIAYLINSILSDNSIKIGQWLIIDGHTVATKTGTSTKENKKAAASSGSVAAPQDGWIFGYTPQVVLGVWTGNTDGSALKMNATGYDENGPIFKAVMAKALEGKPDEPFSEPAGIKHIAVSTISGLLPSLDTPKAFIQEDVFASFAVPTQTDNSFIKVQIDKISGKLATEYTPASAIENVFYIRHTPIAPYENWANAINNWYQTHPEELPEGINIGSEYKVVSGIPPTEYDDVHTAKSEEKGPTITITSPSSNSEVSGNFKVTIDYTEGNGIDRIEYFIDDQLKFTTSSKPYNASLRVSVALADGKSHMIKAKIIDKLGYSAESTVEVRMVKK